MTNEQMAELMKRLDALAAKLGVTAGEVWRILVQQVRVEVYEFWLAAVMTLLFGGAALWMYKRLLLQRRDDKVAARIEHDLWAARKQTWAETHDCSDSRHYSKCYHSFVEPKPNDPTQDNFGDRVLIELYPVRTVGSALFAVAFLLELVFGFFPKLYNLPTLLFNPEYAALQKLIELF